MTNPRHLAEEILRRQSECQKAVHFSEQFEISAKLGDYCASRGPDLARAYVDLLNKEDKYPAIARGLSGGFALTRFSDGSWAITKPLDSRDKEPPIGRYGSEEEALSAFESWEVEDE